MKRIIRSTLMLFCLSICLSTVHAQVNSADTSKPDPSLRGKYQEIISKSKTINGYKLVNPARLSSLWKGISDTLATEKKQLRIAKSTIVEQQKTISSLKTQIEGNVTSIANTNAKMDEITFLGISFNKSTYNTIVWTLIIILAIALAIIVFRSAKLLHEAKYRTGLYDEVAQEYQNYKTKANDKEKKLARELQDERNKLEELRSRGR
jgi:hypothetical protein